MIYKKPKWEASVIPVVPNAVVSFFHSLPDSFEIVPEGHVCVKWPEGLTKETLIRLADKISQQLNAWEFWPAKSAALYALAAIAPEKPKKRKLCVWAIGGDLIVKPSDWAPREHELWRKVGGPFEVDA